MTSVFETENVGIVHDWLTGMRGGERCLQTFCELLPNAPILTLVHEPGSVAPDIESHPIVTSPLSNFGPVRRRYRQLLPLFPWAARQLPGDDFDLLVSLSHCAAKAVRKKPAARHICYCFTPARYLWDLADTYLSAERTAPATRFGARALLPRLRRWDKDNSTSVDRFIAISHHVAKRIERIYGRPSEVIYPPVEFDRFSPAPSSEIGDHVLVVSALAPYKGVELAIEATRRAGLKLRVIGTGQDERRLKALDTRHVEFRGWASDDEVAHEMARAKAFLLPCEEDFGITPLEAMASGRPVLAYGVGGATETVVDGQTGWLVGSREVDDWAAALETIATDATSMDPDACRTQAWKFDVSRFTAEISGVLQEELQRVTSAQETEVTAH